MNDKKEYLIITIVTILYFLGVFINYLSAGIGGALIALIFPPLAILISLAWIGVAFFTILCSALGLY